MGDKKAVILRNHGFLTVGQTVDEAAFWYISFERSAQAHSGQKVANTFFQAGVITRKVDVKQLWDSSFNEDIAKCQ